MDKKRNKIDKELRGFLNRIKKEFKIERIILFGSRARGDESKYSDYDLIVVSEDFRNLNWHRRIGEIVKYWDSDKDIDILPYTSEELKQKLKSRTMVRQAISEGISL